MREITYDVRNPYPLKLDMEYSHNASRIDFKGFDKMDEDSTVYLKIGNPIGVKVALSDMSLVVTSDITAKPGTWKAQLIEEKINMGDPELLHYSNKFDITIIPSLRG